MAKWTSMGHGMRKRMGAPSNHLEAAGKSMARKNATSDEAYEQSGGNSARVPMGMDAYEVAAAPALQGTLVGKHNVQAGDPTAGGKANHANVLYNERLGAAYTVKAAFGATIDPAAGATMANARIVPSVAGRQNPNFESGEQSAYL